MEGSLFKPQTKKGYDFFEVASALQKGIRRGDEKLSMYWTIELEVSGFDQYVWKRFKIIACEDIGLANPNIIPIIHVLHEQYNFLKSKSDAGRRLMIANALLLLCRSKKSRLCDDFVNWAYRAHSEAMHDIPDYAYDKHTRKGKEMGRGVDHFYKEGAKLENEEVGLNTYQEMAIDYYSNGIPMTEYTKKNGKS